MEVKSTDIPYEHRGDKFTIYPIGDIHAGEVTCDEDLLDKTITKIKEDPYARWIGMGDMANFINMQDPRFDITQVSPWVLDSISAGSKKKNNSENDRVTYTIASAAIDWLHKRLSPIADKCLGLSLGNHEETLRLKYENDVCHSLAVKMKVPFLGYCSYLNLCFSRLGGSGSSLVVYTHHGFFAGRLAGGVALNLERMFISHPQADVILVAHGHKRMAVPVPAYRITFRSGKKQILAQTRYAIMTGTFRRSYGEPGGLPTWEERKGFTPNSLGPVTFSYIPDDRLIEVLL